MREEFLGFDDVRVNGFRRGLAKSKQWSFGTKRTNPVFSEMGLSRVAIPVSAPRMENLFRSSPLAVSIGSYWRIRRRGF